MRSRSQHNIWTIEHTFSLPISTFSASGVSHVMRYINVRYLFTYLLILFVLIQPRGCCIPTKGLL